ncbi:hypothetical protein [Methanorbis rubei]|uniref:Beta-1,4-mannosyl-glycoprotein beta-1,4-N-acetylglucosaminyltransferase n=1 Tax=Methanorbis rubei TaxID=3028300 RepID=A0AAE4SDH0_9EURY|nr:hypothetical protein [Methanocorpusculaceae archaeon Cs1]
MIYDCFSFFNELDLLELRLETLDQIIDKFVLVEATKTHSNIDKPLYFDENKERFEKWNDKIIHIIVNEYPEYRTSWTYENYQRNCIMEGLKTCNADDIVIISDIDEIPRPDSILEAAATPGIKCLEMKMYYYYLNYLNYTNPNWSAVKVLRYNEFKKDIDCQYSSFLLEELNEGNTPTKIRHYQTSLKIREAGWHFSYLGGLDKIIYKITSFSHQELNKTKYLEKNVLERKIKEGKDLYNRPDRYMSVPIDSTFPEPIYNNLKKYENYICDFPQPNFFVKYYYISISRIRQLMSVMLNYVRHIFFKNK